MNVYRTANMEHALRTLTQRNHHVVALAEHRVKKMIKLRGRLPILQGVPLMYVQGWKPEAARIIEQWHREGGGLVYRPLPRRESTHPSSDGLLFVEAPLQFDWLEQRLSNVRQEAVIYRPPTWDLHEEAIDHVWPRKHQYETLEAVLASLVGRELTPHMQKIRELIPHWDKFVVFSEDEMAALAGWDSRMLRALLRFKYQMRIGRFPVYRIRFLSTHHSIKWALDILVKQPALDKRLVVLRGDYPFEGKLPSFTSAMRQLVKLNYVAREGCYYMVNMDHRPLDVDRIEAIHGVHRARWHKVKQYVDSLPEYPL